MPAQLPSRVRGIHEAENKARVACEQAVETLLGVFYYLQESILVALNNSGRPLRIATERNNPAFFAFIATARAFSTAKAAMDLALSGHPLEAMALSRVLAETAECTQYLVRHPDKIDRYMSGSFKLDEVLKAAKKEKPASSPYAFGRMRRIQSEFTHASPDLLVIGLTIEGPSLTAPLLILKPEIIDQAIHGIFLILLSQYTILRLTLRDALEPLTELADRDTYLFDPERMRVVISPEGMHEQDLREVRDALVAIGYR